jgi:two-component system, OmpR family, sensor kinase
VIRSIRARLTVWFSAMMAVALVVFSLAVVWLHKRAAQTQFDGDVASLAATLARVMHEEVNERGDLQIAAAEMRAALDVPGRATAILAITGTPILAHWHGFPPDAAARGNEPAAPTPVTVADGSRVWRVATRRETSPVGDFIVLVAGDLAELDREHVLLERLLLAATPLMVLFTAAVSWWVASSALGPVRTMAAQAGRITAHAAEGRLATPAAEDELGQLARAFNRLLDRLRVALQTQRQFMADASHELRTPVSVIQTATEVTLQRPDREHWEYREALSIINEQSSRLSRMVEGMLVLARADAGGYTLARRMLYLDEVVGECVRAASVVAGTRTIELVTDLQPDLSIMGDEGLLRQMVTNLLDNAVQYSPIRAVVTVSLRRDLTHAILTVSDTGPGIAAADRDRVFERFVRLDAARSRPSGAGLGLPIARWIAEQHAGTLVVEPGDRAGATFVARLPLTGVTEAPCAGAETRDQAPGCETANMNGA